MKTTQTDILVLDNIMHNIMRRRIICQICESVWVIVLVILNSYKIWMLSDVRGDFLVLENMNKHFNCDIISGSWGILL